MRHGDETPLPGRDAPTSGALPSPGGQDADAHGCLTMTHAPLTILPSGEAPDSRIDARVAVAHQALAGP